MSKNSHLSLEERFTIANLLNKQTSFKAIGIELGRDCTTISKEVRNHRVPVRTGAPGRAFNECAKRRGCNYRRLCTGCRSNRYCSNCKKCSSVCPDFVRETCPRPAKPPYVCNGCPDRKSCTLEKWFYNAAKAESEYRSVLSETRQGLSLSENEVRHLNSVISPLIRKGQSINHICENNKDAIMVSRSTIYRLVDFNVFDARNMDLPRKVRYSQRTVKKHAKVDKKCRIGRSYTDYIAFRTEHPDLPVVEMDSVEGVKGGKVLLTIHFVKAEFMLAFLRDANDSLSVIEVFRNLYARLGHDRFVSLMPILLTDNGTEFSNPSAIEFTPEGVRRSHVFYCNPSSPHQKGSAERNHELIRYCIPKGNRMDSYSQDEIDRMMNNINSYCRPSLGNKTPYAMMEFLYGKDILELLGCHRIAPNDVTLNPSIFNEEA